MNTLTMAWLSVTVSMLLSGAVWGVRARSNSLLAPVPKVLLTLGILAAEAGLASYDHSRMAARGCIGQSVSGLINTLAFTGGCAVLTPAMARSLKAYSAGRAATLAKRSSDRR